MKSDFADKLITVIVPAFNVGNYIGRCLRSILQQTHRNLEIIIVNDCSTDDTAEIINQIAETDKRIKPVHLTQNVGLHAARVAGFHEAQGEFVAFVDGDDWIGPKMYSRMIKAAVTAAADIVLCCAMIARSQNIVLGPKVDFLRGRTIRQDVLSRFCRLELGSGVIWNRLFRMDIIRHSLVRVLEREVDSGADYIVNFGCFARASCVVILPEFHYFYFMREASMSRSGNAAEKFALVLRCYVACLETYAKKGQEYISSIDTLYSRQLKMPVYRVKDSSDFEPFAEDIAESLRRLARIHPGGVHALIHAFDTQKLGIVSSPRRVLRRWVLP